MRTFKLLDAWISVALIVICAIASMISVSIENLLISYCIVGSWQLVSMFAHSINNWFMKKGGARSYYYWFIMMLFGVVALGFFIPYLLFLLMYLMLVISPLLAIIYTIICFVELRELRLAHSFNLR